MLFRATPNDHQITPAAQMAIAIADTGKPFYEGTVPAATIARRRAKNRAARKARRIHRGQR